MAWRPRRKSGVALYQSPAQRKDTSKIYLMKSLSGLRTKEKIYAIGYNLTTLGAVIPGFNVGALGGIPYFLGEISNNATAIQKALKGDMGAIAGRGKFLGSANLLNRTASKMVSAISSPTGIGAVDRAANIYIGQQKAQFLHYTRNMGKKEQLKVFVEAIGNGKAFDKEIQRQAQVSMKGNVFGKWKTLTYYNAVKNAPDPVKDNPYYQARNAKRNKKLSKGAQRGNFRRINKEAFTTEATDAHINQLVSQTDAMIGNMGIMQDAAKVLAIDELLVHNGADFPRSSNPEGIMRQFKSVDRRLNARYIQGKSDKRDNVIYRNLEPEIETQSRIFTPGARGGNQTALERRKGLKFDEDTGQFSTKGTKKEHDAAYIDFLKTNSTFVRANTRKAGTMEAILVAANSIRPTPNMIKAFNTYAVTMGRNGMDLPGDATMSDFTSKIFSILFTGLGTQTGSTSSGLMGDFQREFGALVALTNVIAKEGYVDIADDLLKVVDPKGKITGNLTKPDLEIPQGTHYMEARKDILQTKQDYSQNLKYGGIFNESDKLLNKKRDRALKEAYVKIMQMDINTNDLEAYDDYLHHMQLHNENKKKLPKRKLNYYKTRGGSRESRLEVAREVMKDDSRSMGLGWLNTEGGRKKDNQIIDKFIDELDMSDGATSMARQAHLLPTGNRIKKIRADRARDIINFVENGVPTEQILNYMERDFTTKMKEIQAALGKGRRPMWLTFKDYETTGEDQIYDKKGEYLASARQGQSTHFKQNNNYVPTKTQIIDAIHMHDIELNGKSEDDGSEFLFRESVSFGGMTQKSKKADRIRDAVQIEFGGPATDKRGQLTNRGDRMFYLPSFFIGTAASQAAAYLGIFDKGASFKANVQQAGLANASFRVADEGVGVLNATRKKYNLKKQKDFEGMRRVKSMFADARKAVNNPNKSNFNRVAHGNALRLANQRAMNLFKRGGGFGQIQIDDVTSVIQDSKMNMFGYAAGPMGESATGKALQFNINKLGTYKKARGSISMQPFAESIGVVGQGSTLGGLTQKTYQNEYAKYKFLTGNFSTAIVTNALRKNRDGHVSFETGYSPLVPGMAGYRNHHLSKSDKALKKNVTSDIVDVSSLISDGTGSFKGARNNEQIASYVANVMGRPSIRDKDIFNMIKDPYSTMDEMFHLGARESGTSSIWHGDYVKGAQDPNHPHNKFMEMFFGSSHKLKEEMIRDYVEIGKSEALPVIIVLQKKGDFKTVEAIERAININAGQIAEAYMRHTAKALQGVGSQILEEQAFRNLTMTFALLMEANKDHFRFELGATLKRYVDTLKLDKKMRDSLRLKSTNDKPFVPFNKGEFDEVEKLLGQGIAFTYDENGVPGFASFDGTTGFLSPIGTDNNLGALIEYLPDFSHGRRTGRKIERIYNINNREDSLLRALGVKNFNEIRWDGALILGQQDVGDIEGGLLRGDMWKLANFLEQEHGIPAGAWVSDSSAMVEYLMKDENIMDLLQDQRSIWTEKVAKGQMPGMPDELMEEIFVLNATLKAKGLGQKARYSKIKKQFGVIVAESTHSKANRSDRTFSQQNTWGKEKTDVFNKVDRSLKEMQSATFPMARGGEYGRRLADDLYNIYFEGGISDTDVGKILVANVKAIGDPTAGGELLKAFAHGMASISYSPALGGQPITKAVVSARLIGIFTDVLPRAGGRHIADRDVFTFTDRNWAALAATILNTNYAFTTLDISWLAPVVNTFKQEQESNLQTQSNLTKRATGRSWITKHDGSHYLKIKDKSSGKIYVEKISKKRYDSYKNFIQKKPPRELR
tara:strand:- start:913 stop:6288 length:5376 start_codon:yes stop_codon:yes gene_type:complete